MSVQLPSHELGPWCRDNHHNWICSLPQGHDGMHADRSMVDGLVYRTWPASDDDCDRSTSTDTQVTPAISVDDVRTGSGGVMTGIDTADHPTLYIRIGSRRRTFHTHGVPFRNEWLPAGDHVRVHTWSRSRAILAMNYRDLRSSGFSAGAARNIVASLMLVPS